MPRKKPQDKNVSTPVKEIQAFRLLPSICRSLKIAADRRGWNKSIYVQEAIRAMLEKDGLYETNRHS